ncbi:MAG TPA: YciI family protein [Opitutaceae bacterium]|nr:YciI family protein [Opitutaceae bacterium]
MASAPASPYLLLFRNTGPENYRHLSADERQHLVVRWNQWFEGLLAQGKAVVGQPLEEETRMVSGPGGARMTDGPFPEAKEAIGGFVTLLVSGFEEATEIARRHPGLDYGMKIEVRAMTPDCHLGVVTRGANEAAASAN